MVCLSRADLEQISDEIIEAYYNDKTLLDNCTEIKRILISSVNTAKENIK